MGGIEQRVEYFVQLWIKETKDRLERDGKLDDELILSVKPKELENCCFVGETDLSTYDILMDKIWVWLFRLQRVATIYNLSENNLIDNIILDIEHESIHKIDAQIIGQSIYTNLDKKVVEAIVLTQQGTIKEDNLKQAIQVMQKLKTS